MSSELTLTAHPPETLEGWYALHQIYTCETRHPDRDDTAAVESADVAARELSRALGPVDDGWSVVVRLIGSMADLMVIHLRPTLDAVGDAQRLVEALPVSAGLNLDYGFLSVTEAGAIGFDVWEWGVTLFAKDPLDSRSS